VLTASKNLVETSNGGLPTYQSAGQPDSKARELATYFVGQVVGSLNKVRPARSVVLDMISEFIDVVGRLDELVDG